MPALHYPPLQWLHTVRSLTAAVLIHAQVLLTLLTSTPLLTTMAGNVLLANLAPTPPLFTTLASLPSSATRIYPSILA